MACREEDIPDVGDTLVYDICDLSILVVRTAPDEIKAYYNACLHRGRLLKERDGNNTELRCPFHGFCWNLDGSLKQVPCAWDFPHVDPAECRLPEVRVGTWGGFVFINMDPDCRAARVVPRRPDRALRQVAARAALQGGPRRQGLRRPTGRSLQEAFMEAFHVVATHPQLLAGIGDANSQYDWWGNFSRAITPNGTPSPHLRFEPTEQEMFDAMSDRRLDEDPFVATRRGRHGPLDGRHGGRMRMARRARRRRPTSCPTPS